VYAKTRLFYSFDFSSWAKAIPIESLSRCVGEQRLRYTWCNWWRHEDQGPQPNGDKGEWPFKVQFLPLTVAPKVYQAMTVCRRKWRDAGHIPARITAILMTNGVEVSHINQPKYWQPITHDSCVCICAWYDPRIK